MSTRGTARRAANTAGNSKALNVLARVGYAASGLVHLLLGYLAIRVAFRQGGETDQAGALAEVAKFPGGVVLLWVIVVGLFALGLWLVVQAVLGIGSTAKKRWMRRVVAAGKAAAYIALGVTALTFALGGSTDGGDSAQQASGTILALPGGQLLLGAVGLIAVAIGGYFGYKGVTKKFEEDLTMPSGGAGRAVRALGITGYVAKGIAVAVVGILFVVAAATLDPQSSTGLDGALKSLAALPFGVVILVAVGLGLVAYGIYTFVRARYARL
jgi:hypothetical protein